MITKRVTAKRLKRKNVANAVAARLRGDSKDQKRFYDALDPDKRCFDSWSNPTDKFLCSAHGEISGVVAFGKRFFCVQCVGDFLAGLIPEAQYLRRDVNDEDLPF